MIDDPVKIWLLLAFPLRGDRVYYYHSITGEGYAGRNYRDTGEAITPTVVVALSTSCSQTSYTTKSRCPGSYAELYNQCWVASPRAFVRRDYEP